MSDGEPQARAAIKSQYARLSEALRNKDLDALRALHTSEYRELEVTGEERDLADILVKLRDELAAMIELSCQIEIYHFELGGDEAKITVRFVQAFVRSLSFSQRASCRIETTRYDYWTNTAVGWCLSRSEKQSVRPWIDGELGRELTFEPPLTAEQRAAVVRDLCARVLPFNIALNGNGFDNLTGLERLIGGARIVGLGEATHGTAEFFQMKHLLIKYLVQRKGYAVLAIEGNWPEAQAADRFIKTGEGSAGAALAAMYFWTWQTNEVSALLQWMRNYNAARGELPVLSFTGFDMQVPNVAIKHVIDALGRASAADRDAVRALYDGMEKLDRWGSETPAGENRRLADKARKVVDLIEAHREMLVSASTPEEYRELCQATRIVLQAFSRRAGIPGAERDRAMAENVRWLIEEAFPEQKIVIWAHNGHIGTDVGGFEKSLGDHLRNRYGGQMVVIGFATHRGELRARLMKEGKASGAPVAMPLAPAREPSVEAIFEETGLPRFILNLRDLPKTSAVGAWLTKPRLHRMIGANYDPNRAFDYYEHVHLLEMYDGIIFIAETTATEPLNEMYPPSN